jgi:esterase/lipase superfamily enzyme
MAGKMKKKRHIAGAKRPLTARAFYSHLQEFLGIPYPEAREWILELERLARRELKRSGEFVVPGIIRFVVLRRKVRMGRQAATRGSVSVAPDATVKARVAPKLKAALMSRREASDRERGSDVARMQRLAAAVLKLNIQGERVLRPDYALGLVHDPFRDVAVEAETVRVFYGTDRNQESKTEARLGSHRADVLSLGWCDVSIPADHRLGSVERPSLLSLYERLDKHFVIVHRHLETEPEAFWTTLHSLGERGPRHALVFIHGFKVSFDDGIYRAAQLSYDLKFQGPTLLYSWASNGRFARYGADIENNDKTVQSLKRFLLSVATRTGIEAVHVIAHSMGNRALVNALYQLALERRPRRAIIKNLILSAPDIDSDVFRDIAAEMAKTAKKTTLYASSKDKALQLSKSRALYPRAGDATEIVIVDGIDTIDASRLRTDFVGHSYFGEHTSVLTDIFEIVHRGTPPAKRVGLHGVPLAAPKYWKFVPTR